MSTFRQAAPSKKEKFLMYNTLVGLVKSLENIYTTIDLRNECYVSGRITKVDGYMNVEMENVIFYDLKGNRKSLNNFFMHARNIRNVHIPPTIDILSLFMNGCSRDKTVRHTIKRTFKTARAAKRNAQTVAEAYGKN